MASLIAYFMIFSLVHISNWLSHYGYIILIPLIIVEGPIVSVIGGSLCVVGIFSLFYLYPIVVFADLLADCLYSLAGRIGGKKFVSRYGRYLGINLKQLSQIKNHFDSNGGKTLFIGKIWGPKKRTQFI